MKTYTIKRSPSSKEGRPIMLREQLYAQIRQDIIELRFAPGEVLIESELAQLFETSKTPIREALTSLQRDNLVEYKPNKGFTVTPISIRDIHEIFDTRVILECAVFRLAVQHIDDEKINKLEKILEVTYDSNDPATLQPYMQANVDFHMEIALTAQNSRLCRYYDNLLGESQRLLYMDVKYHNIVSTWLISHERIINALKRRDAEAGAKEIEEIEANARKRFLNS
jgi:DNA-binding GntR family transcriptional regulator